MSNETAKFSATLSDMTAPTTSTQKRVRGKIFHVGEFASHGFSLSAAEAQAAVAAFQPCEADLEHKQTVLSGKMPQLAKIELDASGNIIGELVEPRWFSDLLGDAPRRVSCTWDKMQKRLTGIAYTLAPAISDAAVFAAFSATTDENGVDWQEVERARKQMGYKPKDGTA